MKEKRSKDLDGNNRDLHNLRQLVTSRAAERSIETIFDRVKQRFDAEGSTEQEHYAALQFNVMKGDKPVADAEISVTGPCGDNDKVKWNGTRRTTEKGRGFVSLSLSLAGENPELQVILSRDPERVITVQQLKPSFSGKRTYEKDDYVLEAEWLTDYSRLPDPEGKGRTRKFNIAVASGEKDLEKAVDMINRHDCFQLKQIFIEGKKPKEIELPKKVSVTVVGKSIESELDDVDFILDFSGSELLSKLRLSQIQGDRKIPAIIVSARRFSGKIEQFERALLPADRPNIKRGD